MKLKLGSNPHHRKGLIAEYIVMLRYLTMGFWPIHHRLRSSLGEIDLILRRGSTVIFCEVKARGSKFTHEKYVSETQEKRLRNSADHFLSKQKFKISKVRFDLVVVHSVFNVKMYKGWIGW